MALGIIVLLCSVSSGSASRLSADSPEIIPIYTATMCYSGIRIYSLSLSPSSHVERSAERIARLRCSANATGRDAAPTPYANHGLFPTPGLRDPPQHINHGLFSPLPTGIVSLNTSFHILIKFGRVVVRREPCVTDRLSYRVPVRTDGNWPIHALYPPTKLLPTGRTANYNRVCRLLVSYSHSR